MQFYPRERKKVDGLNDEELEEAMKIYTDGIKDKIIEKLQSEFGIRLDIDESEELISFFHYVIDEALTEGMELAASRWKLIDYFEQHKKIKVDQVNNYDFEMDKGVSGVLFADGSFKKCGNAQHQLIVSELSFDQQLECIYFSSTLFGDGSGVISHSPVGFQGASENQIKWMKLNFKYMDRGQKRTAWADWNIQDTPSVPLSDCCEKPVKRGRKLAQEYNKFYCTKCQKECNLKS